MYLEKSIKEHFAIPFDLRVLWGVFFKVNEWFFRNGES